MTVERRGGVAGERHAELAPLALAFLLSSVIGFERELRQKSAGLRTHTLVGVGAATFVLVSKYGFSDVLVDGRIGLDPSRVASQVVAGIGFIGAGVIFVKRDGVRGLTTAAAIWLTAAVGLAAGAGLVAVAVGATLIHLIVSYVYTPLVRRLPPTRTTLASIEATTAYRFDTANPLGVKIPLLVTDARRTDGEEWHRVLLPMRPNGPQRLVRASEVKLVPKRERIVVDLSDRTLRHFRNGRRVQRFRVG